MGHGEHAGAAMRRRERRLRAMLRHERMTVAMVLSEKKHHTSRGQNKDRTMGEENVMNCTAKLRKTPPPTAASTEDDPMVLDEGGALAAGGRPAPLSEVAGWQERVQRHCVEHLAEVCPIVQILDADVLVPLLVDQYAAIWNMEEDILVAADHLDRDFEVPELVIEVPKISLDVIPLRTLVPEPQLAEQLVEVQTIVLFSSFQRIMEQTVDIPVPQGGGRHADLQGFLRGKSSTGAEQIVDIPGGGLHRPGQSSSSADEPGKGVFRTFPQNKKVRSWARTRGRNCSPSRAHPRRLLSWRTPSSGCCSRTATLASLTAGTDVLSVLSGSRRLALRLCGSAKGTRREGSGTGTGIRVPPRLTSLLFLLSEELHRQPRAVYK